MKLNELFDNQPDIEISSVVIDSRKVTPGSMFFCIVGTAADGHEYAASAAEKGASVIVCSKDIPQAEGVIYIKVENTVDELNRVCNVFNGRPSEKMTIFAVTGTNGKSTIATIIKDIYSHHVLTGYIGTIGVQYGNVERCASLTTPDQVELQSDLAEMYQAGCRAAALEASSHGLTQGRMDSIDIDCALFTQLTHEHLDYHKTMENYLEAKKLLFKNIKKEGVAVLNADDDISIEGLKECCNCRYVSYGLRDDVQADYKASEVEIGPRYSCFNLTVDGKTYPVKVNLIAEYNISNILAVIAACNQFGMAIEEIIPLLDHIPQVAGRMEVIDEGQDFHVIVDFAHTPDAFEKVFAFTEKVSPAHGKVYAVFGSSGRRDVTKRPIMGEIAGRHADEIVTTKDDPRDEDPAMIGEQIMEGFRRTSGNKPCRFIASRAEAIEYVVSKAQKDDIIMLLGQGRQPYYVMANNYREPYDGDHLAAKKVIRKKLGLD